MSLVKVTVHNALDLALDSVVNVPADLPLPRHVLIFVDLIAAIVMHLENVLRAPCTIT